MTMSLPPPAMHRYRVWFDLLLDEYFCIEDGKEASQLLEKLDREGIKASLVEAYTPAEALAQAFPERNPQASTHARLH